MPVIRVDDEVFRALQATAEPFVDTPTSVLRRVLRLDPVADDRREARGRRVAARSGDAAEPTGRRQRKEERVSSITPEVAYRPVILRCTRNAGGEADLPELIRSVQHALASELTSADHEPVTSSGEPRWRNNLRWALKHMKDEGLLQNPRRGHYMLTERGQRYGVA